MTTFVNCRRPDNEDEPLFVYQGRFTGIDKTTKSLLVANNQLAPGNFVNNTGALLLPSNLTYDHCLWFELLCLNLTTVTYDAMGRIHLLILSSCSYIIMDKLWSPVQQIKSTVQVSGINHAQHTLVSDISLFGKLLLPPNRPAEFLQWQPCGQYEVIHDDQGRVFSVKREEDGTDIQMCELWEPRFQERFLPPKSINNDDDMI
jgi:hypothetical protein